MMEPQLIYSTANNRKLLLFYQGQDRAACSHHCYSVLYWRSQPEQPGWPQVESIQIGDEEVEPPRFAHDMILRRENL